MIRKLVVEFIGTFFLVLTIGLTVIGADAGTVAAGVAPLAIGSALMVMVYAGGHISGAHYNPAVTLGVWIRGKCTTKEVIPYMLAQVAGAMVASMAVLYLKGYPAISPALVEARPAFWAELMFTFALVYVVLNVATASGTEGNSNYGLAIGFTVTSGAYAVGSISGGVFNPAVMIGLVGMDLLESKNLTLYISAQAIAAVAAAVSFRLLRLGADKATSATSREQAALLGAAETGGVRL
jgi:aquaporin Z